MTTAEPPGRWVPVSKLPVVPRAVPSSPVVGRAPVILLLDHLPLIPGPRQQQGHGHWQPGQSLWCRLGCVGSHPTALSVARLPVGSQGSAVAPCTSHLCSALWGGPRGPPRSLSKSKTHCAPGAGAKAPSLPFGVAWIGLSRSQGPELAPPQGSGVEACAPHGLQQAASQKELCAASLWSRPAALRAAPSLRSLLGAVRPSSGQAEACPGL